MISSVEENKQLGTTRFRSVVCGPRSLCLVGYQAVVGKRMLNEDITAMSHFLELEDPHGWWENLCMTPVSDITSFFANWKAVRAPGLYTKLALHSPHGQLEQSQCPGQRRTRMKTLKTSGRTTVCCPELWPYPFPTPASCKELEQEEFLIQWRVVPKRKSMRYMQNLGKDTA